jgi:hypothetical protein
MSHDAHPPTPSDRLDAYLDGLLEGEELAAFERQIEQDAALRAEVQAQRGIDDALGRLFSREKAISLRDDPREARTVAFDGATAPADPPLRLADAPRARVRWSLRSNILVGIAAMLAITFVGLYATGLLGPGYFFGNDRPIVQPWDVYTRKVSTGFNPDWVCESDEQFVKTTHDLWGESLLARGTDLVQIVGWSYYEPVFSPSTGVLLTKVEGTEVIVVMDRVEKDRRLKAPQSSGLHLFRDVKGGVVVYEVTPFKEPRVIPLIRTGPFP